MQKILLHKGFTFDTDAFRKLLINKCQREYEKISEYKNVYGEKLKKLQEYTDLGMKNEFQLCLEKEEEMMHKEFVNFIHFLGLLFQQNNILTFKIMDHCIRGFISEAEEKNLEFCCILLNTIGQTLELKKLNFLRTLILCKS